MDAKRNEDNATTTATKVAKAKTIKRNLSVGVLKINMRSSVDIDSKICVHTHVYV